MVWYRNIVGRCGGSPIILSYQKACAIKPHLDLLSTYHRHSTNIQHILKSHPQSDKWQLRCVQQLPLSHHLHISQQENLSKSHHICQDLPKSYHICQDLPKSYHICQDLPKSHQHIKSPDPVLASPLQLSSLDSHLKILGLNPRIRSTHTSPFSNKVPNPPQVEKYGVSQSRSSSPSIDFTCIHPLSQSLTSHHPHISRSPLNHLNQIHIHPSRKNVAHDIERNRKTKRDMHPPSQSLSPNSPHMSRSPLNRLNHIPIHPSKSNATYNFEKNLVIKRCVHTDPPKRDIPLYLQGNTSEVLCEKDDLFPLDDEEEFYNDMEDDITDFLIPRLINYEETDTSIVISCPLCSSTQCDSQTKEIFIDKNTGHFVCPWCNEDGSWEELMNLINNYEEGLTNEQLNEYLASTVPVSHLPIDALNQSPLKGVSVGVLERFGGRLTSDESRIVFPIKNHVKEDVGFQSVSLLHPIPQIIRRYVVGKSRPFTRPGGSVSKEVVFVPTCCDVLVLAQHNIQAVSLPCKGDVNINDYYGVENVLLWYRGEPPPRQLLLDLIHSGIPASIVQSKENDTPIHRKSITEINACLNNTLPILSEYTTTFQQIKDKVYHRLTHKEETCGAQWGRFTALNDIVLGHRLGEMTVITGPTGSGKTTFMSEYSLDLCCQGVRTLWGSFEISLVRLCEVMLHQFTGAALPHDLTEFNTIAAEFSKLPLHFLTYHGQQDITSVLKVMNEAVDVWGIEHVIIDNLQFMLGTLDENSDRWFEQDKAVSAFRKFASTRNCHVTIIAHPKKVPEGQPLVIGSIYGGAKVTQEADNVFILQVKESSSLAKSRKILQVVKNRYGGQLGEVPLKFHKESLTLSSFFRNKGKNKNKDGEEKDVQNKNSEQSSIRKLRLKRSK